ncbi:MAG: lysine--tRNA ligase [Planctomycetes bacterium]|nr:lysine--tRNA ligase [Planctomycetota bacterium]
MPGEYEQHRRKKAEALRAQGLDPFGRRYPETIDTAGARKRFEAAGEGAPATVAGRMLALREFGKLIFADLWDSSGRIQVAFSKKTLPPQMWDRVKLLDLGDWVGVEGRLVRTRTGEITVDAARVDVLAKALLPPPEKWHGLTDVEARYRQRYVDLFANPEVRDLFLRRSLVIDEVRRFLRERGFVEVETPVLQPLYGGAAARPFVTHHNTLDVDLYLRISPELYLKRLLVGGMERVFEIARVFRNEGISTRHNPEFTLMELYQAFADYGDMMELVETLVERLARTISGGRTCLPFQDKVLEYKAPWRRALYADLLAEHAGVRLGDEPAVRARARTLGLEESNKHVDVVTHDVFEAAVEPHIVQPTFVMDWPARLCPLTKRKADNPDIAERFEPMVAGMEIGNAYTELNDPDVQAEALRTQLAGQQETMAVFDADFVEALKHGMPPAGGLGIGIDRLVMLLVNAPSIRDVVLFPALRPKGSPGAAGTV